MGMSDISLSICLVLLFYVFIHCSQYTYLFQGDVTSQGLLLKREKATCYRRRHVLKKPKMRPCQFFVFEQTILICEVPIEEINSTSPQQLDHFCDFKVSYVR